MRKRAGSVPEVSVFQTEISLSALENFAIWTLHPGYRDESGKNSTAQMASCCFAHCIFHIISIPFNRSDSAIRVAKATIGAKVITLYFALVALFHEFRARTRSDLFSSRESGWNFSYEPQEISSLMQWSGHLASRSFYLLAWFWRTRERLCMNWVRPFLSMRGMLLGYSLQPRPYSRALGTAGSVMTIGLSINWCLRS